MENEIVVGMDREELIQAARQRLDEKFPDYFVEALVDYCMKAENTIDEIESLISTPISNESSEEEAFTPS
jgi:hypothetical protein